MDTEPLHKFLPYGRQWIDEEDIKAVVEILRGDWLTQGPKVPAFEKALADYCGAKFAVVFSSGTAALHAAYSVIGIGENDEIITSPITFLSTANAALYCGARPVFVDIEADSGNIDPNLIEPAITTKTKAIIPVDFAGYPVDLERIWRIATEHNLLVIEDACHALGAQYHEDKIGNCWYSDLVVFSFHPIKSITTGEGGAVLTDSKEFQNKLEMFRICGVTKDPTQFNFISPGDWYHEMQILGFNYRLTDFQAALGISQLKKLNKFIRRRRKIARIYTEAFKNNKFFDLPQERDYAKSSWHLYPIRLRDKYKERKSEIFAQLRRGGLGIQVHYIPVYLQPYYQQLGYPAGICPTAEDFYQREISLPIYQSMDDTQIQCVIRIILENIY